MVNAATGTPNADTITGLANCSATTNPGPSSTLSPPPGAISWSNANPPVAGFTQCAVENMTCTVSGTKPEYVVYGANGQYFSKANVTGSITCNNTTFGGDPIPGTVKACYSGLTQPPQSPYTLCAPENGSCSFTGTQNVAFGANGHFFYKTNVTSPITCNNATFGGDPIPGTVKSCYYGPGQPGTVASGAANAHGSGHSVAADLVHNYIFVPIPSNNFATGMTGVCASKGGSDTNGCIAVYSTVGKD